MRRVVLLVVVGVGADLDAVVVAAEVDGGRVATGDVDADTVALPEQVAGRPDLDLVPVDLVRLDVLRLVVQVVGPVGLAQLLAPRRGVRGLEPPPGEDVALGRQPGDLFVVGRLIDEATEEVRVALVRRGVEHEDDVAGHLEILLSGSLTNVGMRRVKWTMPSSMGAVPPPEKCVQSSSG